MALPMIKDDKEKGVTFEEFRKGIVAIDLRSYNI